MAEGQAPSGFRDPREPSRSSSEAVAQENPAPIRHCPFCDAPFTPRMQAWMGGSAGCACCGGTTVGHWPIKVPVRDTPELACEACGKVLYRAP